MKYRKKPVVIEAIQFTGDNNPFGCVEKHSLSIINDRPDCSSVMVDTIKTLEGYHQVSVGDFVIKGVKGELYPCKPDIFEATYERVKDGGK